MNLNRIKIYLIVVAMLVIMPIKVFALNEVNIYLFWGDGCPHCESEMEYLEILKNHYSNIKIYKFETWYNEENKDHLKNIRSLYQYSKTGVPFTVVGDSYVAGFGNSTKSKIEELVRKYSLEDYASKADKYFNNTHNTNIEGSLADSLVSSSSVNNENNNIQKPSSNDNNNNNNLEIDNKKNNTDSRVVTTLVLFIIIIVLLAIYFLTKKRSSLK